MLEGKTNYHSMNFIPLSASDSKVSLTSGTQRTSSSLSICKTKGVHTYIYLILIAVNHYKLGTPQRIKKSTKQLMGYEEEILASEKSMAGKRVRYSVMLLLLSQGWTPCT